LTRNTRRSNNHARWSIIASYHYCIYRSQSVCRFFNAFFSLPTSPSSKALLLVDGI